MAGNEYKAKEDLLEEAENKASKKEPKAKKSEKKEAKNPLDGLKGKFNSKKFNTSYGSFLLLMAVFLFLACFSYLFTWKVD
ncbi:MAG: hypothetical protein K9G40_12335, partial [Crocinitomicaceae bacterium]|nr:hypothetical protein [Crocinitomicaceae bacterium]